MANRLPPPPVFHRPSPRGSGSRSNTSSSTSHGFSSSSTNSPSRMMAIRGGGGSGTSSTSTTTMMTTTTPEQDELTNKLEALLMSPEQDDDIDSSTNENEGSSTKKNNQFSVAKYLNLALSNDALLMTSTGGRSLSSSSVDVTQLQQTKMAELALQLQLESQKCHNTIEQIGLDLINGILPRCDSDITRLKVGLDGLKQDTTHLYKESKPFVLSNVSPILVDGNELDGTTSTSKETKDSSGATATSTTTSPRSAVVVLPSPVVVNAQSPPLELLTTLHALKKNLTLTKSILSAASSWDATVSTIPALLSPPSNTEEGSRTAKAGSGTTSIANLMEAVQALSTLEHGARALRGLPGVEERDSILSAVRSKIEILLRPKLLHALQQSRSVNVTGSSSAGGGSNSNLAAALSALQQVANMYKLLGKTEMLQTEYVKARPAAIHKAWFSFKGGVGIGVGGAGGGAVSSSSITGGRTNSSVTNQNKKKKKKKMDDEAENYDIQFDDSDDDEEKDDDNDEDDEMNVMPSESSSAITSQQSFVTWTQEWYESILVLLSEERRRTMSVFGADMSREIIAKILAECFRPLLSSYSSRLETLFSSNITRLTQQQPSSSSSIQSYSSNAEYPSSFAAVCAVYESTLRFLSMVYDANLQGIPLKTVKQIFVNVTSPYAPYQQQYATLEQYYCQYNYNTKYTSLLLEMKQEIGGEGNSGRHGGARRTTNDEDNDQETYALTNLLIDTSERMSYLTVELFPIVEGCLGRYELLNCGYNASAAMETIDAIMSRYITTLSNAVDSLTKSFTTTAPTKTTKNDGTTSSTSSEEWMAHQFDEQHVQYALELFQSIGRMNIKLNQFQQRTRDRLKSLCSGMRASIHFDEDSSTTDSLSLVEVAALLSREVLLVGGNSTVAKSSSGTAAATLVGSNKTNSKSTTTKPMTTASTIAQLQYLSGESRTRSGAGGGTTTNTTAGLPSLYPQSFIAMEQLSKSGQRFVFDILCCVPRMWLRSVASMPVWRGSGGASDALGSAISSFAGALAGGAGGGTDSYNKLPQQYITQVGEHVLALVQALEPFASNSESLALVKDVMNGLPYSVASQPWNDMVSATGCGINVERDVNVMKSLMKGKVLKQHPWILLGNNAQHHGYYDDDNDEDEAEAEQGINNNDHHERDAEQFCNEWLNVVCLAVTGRYLQGILRIARLSNHGRAHMEADINYILNVFSAIGIPGHPHPLLVHVLEIISMDHETLSLRIDQMSSSTSNNDGANETNDKIFKLLKSMEQQLASMRGIGIH